MISLNNQSGIALILALLLSVIFVTLGIAIQYQIKNDVELLDKQLTKLDIAIETTNSINLALYELLTSDFLYNQSDFTRTENLAGQNGERGKLSIFISNANNKLSIAEIDRQTLLRLFSVLFTSQADVNKAVDSYLDWVDADSLSRVNGMESREYRMRGKVEPKNMQLDLLDEISLINGFEDTDILQLKRMLTIYPVSNWDRSRADSLLLSAYYSDDIVQRLKNGVSNKNASTLFGELTGDTLRASEIPGVYYLNVDTNVFIGEVAHKLSFDVKLQPFRTVPFRILPTYF